MGYAKQIKTIFLEADLFYSSDILRYNNDSKYKTVSGAVFSLIIMMTIVVGFSSMIISTMEKNTFESSLQVKKTENPSTITLKADESKFMLGYFVHSMDKDKKMFDLKKGPQIFDYQALVLQFQNGLLKNTTPIQLESCTRQHWKHIPYMIQRFDSIGIDKWLCNPLNLSLSFGGYPTSSSWEIASFNLIKCVNSTNNNNKCAPESVIEETYANYTNFMLRFSFINPVINPGEPDYIKYYLQDRNNLIFSNKLGAQMRVEISDYEIKTDASILPYESVESEKGYIIQQDARNYVFDNGGKSLAHIMLSKSPNSLLYKRTVLKISNVISFIGGLVGAITALMFFMKLYTQTALEINMSLDLFQDKPNEKPQETENKEPERIKFGFNLVNFLSMYVYKCLKWCDKGEDGFQIAKRMQEYQDEIEKQLDIKIMLRRLIKLEYCIFRLFDEAEITKIRNFQNISYEKAKQLRTLLHKQEFQEQIRLQSQKNDKKMESSIHEDNLGSQSSQGSPSFLNKQSQMIVQAKQAPKAYVYSKFKPIMPSQNDRQSMDSDIIMHQLEPKVAREKDQINQDIIDQDKIEDLKLFEHKSRAKKVKKGGSQNVKDRLNIFVQKQMEQNTQEIDMYGIQLND